MTSHLAEEQLCHQLEAGMDEKISKKATAEKVNQEKDFKKWFASVKCVDDVASITPASDSTTISNQNVHPVAAIMGSSAAPVTYMALNDSNVIGDNSIGSDLLSFTADGAKLEVCTNGFTMCL
ncbi:hypothetical protein PILCRDRAFT_4945 [Piloderma croceum F 1598]|uniref:Uncharacterized protein n=1 Tax=Piloderma croceum (strain F 1598) TaxID=765440 RepID=A0A0C3G3H6_PILCF|nr:hypothetical protein PILCRDRAFT_4945 [Piloderma croceum F 1598]